MGLTADMGCNSARSRLGGRHSFNAGDDSKARRIDMQLCLLNLHARFAPEGGRLTFRVTAHAPISSCRGVCTKNKSSKLTHN